MDDLISRQAAIDALDGELTITGRENAETIRDYINSVNKKLRELPSAERRGRWIKGDEMADYPRIPYKAWETYCSCCGEIKEQINDNFCGNCGASMYEVEDNG